MGHVKMVTALSLVCFSIVLALLVVYTILVIYNVTGLYCSVFYSMKTEKGTGGFYKCRLPEMLRSAPFGVQLRIVDKSFPSLYCFRDLKIV